MSPITFRDVTKHNWLDCVRLQLTPDQGALVAPNVWSLAEARVGVPIGSCS